MSRDRTLVRIRRCSLLLTDSPRGLKLRVGVPTIQSSARALLMRNRFWMKMIRETKHKVKNPNFSRSDAERAREIKSIINKTGNEEMGSMRRRSDGDVVNYTLRGYLYLYLYLGRGNHRVPYVQVTNKQLMKNKQMFENCYIVIYLVIAHLDGFIYILFPLRVRSCPSFPITNGLPRASQLTMSSRS